MEQLIKLREAKGLTQREVADYLKVGRTTYVKYETGDINLPLQSAIKLAEFYNISTDYLLGRSDIPNMESLQLFAEPAKNNQPPKPEADDDNIDPEYPMMSEIEMQIIKSLPELSEEEKAAVNSLINHYVNNKKKENDV